MVHRQNPKPNSRDHVWQIKTQPQRVNWAESIRQGTIALNNNEQLSGSLLNRYFLDYTFQTSSGVYSQ